MKFCEVHELGKSLKVDYLETLRNKLFGKYLIIINLKEIFIKCVNIKLVFHILIGII